MTEEHKTLTRSIPALLLFAYSLLVCAGGLIKVEDGAVSVNAGVALLAASGVMAASIFFARRHLTDGSCRFMVWSYTALTILVGVVGVVSSALTAEGDLVGGAVSAVASALAVLMLIFVCAKALPAVDTMSQRAFVILLLVCCLLVPSAMLMLSGVITFVAGIVLLAAAAAGGAQAVGEFIKNPDRPSVTYQTKYLDQEGGEHDTAYGAECKNKEINERS